ncbi:MAG: TRAP transporter small permease [Planctomycetota bacterium]|jgi:TRAP-type C4-dicarboxylate transport system permease small subunit
MKGFFTILDHVLHTLLFMALAAMATIVAANVFGRFIVGKSISWGEEVAKVLLTYLTFLGAAYAMRDNSHYAFDFALQKMPQRVLRHFLAFRWLAVIIMSVLLVYWSAEVTIRIRDWIMPATGINRALVYVAAPIGTFFLLLYSIRNFTADMKNPRIHEEEEVIKL